MDNNTPNNNPPNQVPVIPESEMKLPEEQFGETPEAPTEKSGLLTPVLLVLLVVLLATLAAAVIWGEEIVDMFMPAETVPLEMAETEEEGAALEDIESELETVDFTAMEDELNSIEAEIDAEAAAEASSETP